MEEKLIWRLITGRIMPSVLLIAGDDRITLSAFCSSGEFMDQRIICGFVLTQKIMDRFFALVKKSGPDECWEWKGCRAGKKSRMYGYFKPTRTRGMTAQRFSYQALVQPIPDHLVVDHICRNPLCVNPKHLEAVPTLVNQLRGNRNQMSGKLYCSKGHKYTPENTYIFDGRYRGCKICRREATYRHRERKRHGS